MGFVATGHQPAHTRSPRPRGLRRYRSSTTARLAHARFVATVHQRHSSIAWATASVPPRSKPTPAWAGRSSTSATVRWPGPPTAAANFPGCSKHTQRGRHRYRSSTGAMAWARSKPTGGAGVRRTEPLEAYLFQCRPELPELPPSPGNGNEPASSRQDAVRAGEEPIKKAPSLSEGAIDLAASYSPTGSPLQYHRRWKA